MSKRQLEELKKLLELNETLEDTLEKMSLMYTHLEDIGREEGNTLIWSLDFPDMSNIIVASLDDVALEQSNHVERLKDFVNKLED